MAQNRYDLVCYFGDGLNRGTTLQDRSCLDGANSPSRF